MLDQVVGIVGGVLHRHHARALLARFGVEQDFVDVQVEIVRKQIAQDKFWVGLKYKLGVVWRRKRWRLCCRQFQSGDFTDGEKLETDGDLRKSIDKSGSNYLDLVHFFLQEKITSKSSHSSGFCVRRRVAVRKLCGKLPAGSRNELRRSPPSGDKKCGLGIKLCGDPKHVAIQGTAQALIGSDEDNRAFADLANFKQWVLEIAHAGRRLALNRVQQMGERTSDDSGLLSLAHFRGR